MPLGKELNSRTDTHTCTHTHAHTHIHIHTHKFCHLTDNTSTMTDQCTNLIFKSSSKTWRRLSFIRCYFCCSSSTVMSSFFDDEIKNSKLS